MARTKSSQTKSLPEQVKAKSKQRRRKKLGSAKKIVVPDLLIPSGSTMLNLACSDTAAGAFLPGSIVNTVGDKSTGKTIQFYTMCGAICKIPAFDHYRLIHRDVEAAMNFDVPTLFGKKADARIERTTPIKTIQEFTADIFHLIEKGEPFIYALDSFDTMTSDEEIKKFKAKVAPTKGKKAKGSYGVEKTKGLGGLFRLMTQGLKETGSLLVIISQVRENMDGGAFSPKFYRTGGRSLGHHAFHEIWLWYLGRVTQEVKKRKRQIGTTTIPKIEKNRLTGKRRECSFNIYNEYGIDDIGSIIDFMLFENFWKKEKGKSTIIADSLGLEGNRTEIIHHIESNNLERRLQHIVQKAWLEIEESMKLNRKPRFE